MSKVKFKRDLCIYVRSEFRVTKKAQLDSAHHQKEKRDEKNLISCGWVRTHDGL